MGATVKGIGADRGSCPTLEAHGGTTGGSAALEKRPRRTDRHPARIRAGSRERDSGYPPRPAPRPWHRDLRKLRSRCGTAAPQRLRSPAECRCTPSLWLRDPAGRRFLQRRHAPWRHPSVLTQQLPVPLLTLRIELPIGGALSLTSVVTGGWLPSVNRLRSEGGVVRISQGMRTSRSGCAGVLAQSSASTPRSKARTSPSTR